MEVSFWWRPYHKLASHKFRALSVLVRDYGNLHFSHILIIKITHRKFYDLAFHLLVLAGKSKQELEVVAISTGHVARMIKERYTAC
jgi:hypothetical protein